jgi:adenylate cyclase
MSVTRRLAAILAADVVGFSRLMEQDEAGTLAALKARRKDSLEPLVAKHAGRVFKVTGDGVLVEFASAVNAVQCAVDLQQAFADANRDLSDERRIVLRIGVNLGDVMVEGGDLYGDGVNIAARLETIAEPGGIVVSEDAHRQVRNKLATGFDDLGAQTLKNIAEPVRAYRATGTPVVAVAPPEGKTPSKPSIAVLPFDNLSGDPGQEYFSDGVTEEIISGLARLHWLFVIARNSSFTFKGKAVDVKQVGRQLGVRYVLEGSVRKSGERVRITSQLIDAASGAHLWSDRFDGALSDIFDLQDKVTASVVGAIEPALRHAEIERARAKPTESVDAYDLYLRALALHGSYTLEGTRRALRLLERAIAIDPSYASALALAAHCNLRQWTAGWISLPTPLVEEGIRLARLAARAGQDDPVALWMAGLVLALSGGAVADAGALIDRSLAINPNSAQAWMAAGFVRAYAGEVETAIASLEQSARLSPLDPLAFLVWHGIAIAHFSAGRYDEAARWADRTLRESPDFVAGLRLKGALCGLLGQREEGRDIIRRLLALNPDATVAGVGTLLRQVIGIPRLAETLLQGLRQAGLPE